MFTEKSSINSKIVFVMHTIGICLSDHVLLLVIFPFIFPLRILHIFIWIFNTSLRACSFDCVTLVLPRASTLGSR